MKYICARELKSRRRYLNPLVFAPARAKYSNFTLKGPSPYIKRFVQSIVKGVGEKSPWFPGTVLLPSLHISKAIRLEP